MLVVAYPAGIGPAFFVGHEWRPRLRPHIGRADVPIYRLACGTGLLPLWKPYTGWWVDLAYRRIRRLGPTGPRHAEGGCGR